jgi:hypothetical protein
MAYYDHLRGAPSPGEGMSEMRMEGEMPCRLSSSQLVLR